VATRLCCSSSESSGRRSRGVREARANVHAIVQGIMAVASDSSQSCRLNLLPTASALRGVIRRKETRVVGIACLHIKCPLSKMAFHAAMLRRMPLNNDGCCT